MKKVLAVLILAAAMPLAAWADDGAPPPCVQASLEWYMQLEGGCTIGDKIFSDFTYENVVIPGGEAGPVEILASGVTVTPDSTALNPGLTFQGGWAATEAGQVSDIQIGFTVTVMQGGGAIEDASLSIPGSVAVGGGSVIAGETLWLGCTGPCDSSAQLEAWNFPGDNDQIYDHTTFDPVMVVTVEKDIILVATGEGEVNFASVSIIHQNFSEVPEPATLTLLGTGLVGLGGMIRRRKKSK